MAIEQVHVHLMFIVVLLSCQIGAGTSLPGVLAACLGMKVTLSDSGKLPGALDSCRRTIEANRCHVQMPVEVTAITWGEVNAELLELPPVDLIIASDCFYDKKGDDSMPTLFY